MQIVAECLVNSSADELARLGVARKENGTVDFRRLA
jgi:hypothetical protein